MIGNADAPMRATRQYSTDNSKVVAEARPHLSRHRAAHSSETPGIVRGRQLASRQPTGPYPERLPATNDFRFARPSERIAEALRSVVFLSLSTLLGTSPFPTPSRELFMVLPGGCLSAPFADASGTDHFGEGV